ncbi:MAG TPA: TetR family transcriptional regulator [Trebonia sp.]|jgi:TetR/AcrR family tetracycline transcriptional repressor|nr:TetR family transcriptional regulator [Trebonia sp.]
MDDVHSARRRRGAPPAGQRLTRDDVITRASQMIATDGLAAFSLRGLADALGVAPNALYNHVRDREDLLGAVTDRFVAGIRLPAGQQPWPDWLRAAAVSLRAQLTGRPGLTELILARAGASAAGPDALARFLDRLTSAGIHRALAHVAWHALLTVTVGSLAQEQARGKDQAATFEAVLDLTITGLLAAAQQPPTPQAMALLKEHELAR